MDTLISHFLALTWAVEHADKYTSQDPDQLWAVASKIAPTVSWSGTILPVKSRFWRRTWLASGLAESDMPWHAKCTTGELSRHSKTFSTLGYSSGLYPPNMGWVAGGLRQRTKFLELH